MIGAVATIIPTVSLTDTGGLRADLTGIDAQAVSTSVEVSATDWPTTSTQPAGTEATESMTAPAPPTTTTSAPTNPVTSTTALSPGVTTDELTIEQRGQLGLATIDYDWRSNLPGWTITFSSGRDGMLGLTYVESKTIEIFVRNGQSNTLLAHVIAHEMGHAVDVTLNNSDDRRRWQEAREIESASWWPGDGTTDFSTGAGDFAESFAAWQVGPSNFRSKLDGAPDAKQLGLMAELSAG